MQARHPRVVGAADDRVTRRRVELDPDLAGLVAPVGDVRKARRAAQVRPRRGRRRGTSRRAGAAGAGAAAVRVPSPPRAAKKPAEAATRRAAACQSGRETRGRGAEAPDPAPNHLVLEQLEGRRAEFGGDARARVRAEVLPGRFERDEIGAAAGALADVFREGVPLRGTRIPQDAGHRDLGQFTAFHEASPSENRAFRVSTARKIRVLTAPTEIPRTLAISE